MLIRVAIVDDALEVREGLAYLINGSPGFECVAEYASAEEALEQLPSRQPEIVLLDIGLPGMSGIDCIPELKARLPNAQVMMLTVFEDYDRVFRSLAAGATGYLVKKTPPAKLLEALHDLHAGGSPMSNHIARRLVEEFQKPPAPALNPAAANLSKREREVLDLLAKGFLYKEVAESLAISIETVRTHIRNMYEKLHVRTRHEAVLKAFPHGNPSSVTPQNSPLPTSASRASAE